MNKHVLGLTLVLLVAFALATEIKLTSDGGVIKKIIKEGSGDTPTKGASVSVHYVGTLENGDKFDSSRDRDQKFDFNVGVGQVIKGWDMGIMTMKRGEVATFEIAPEYGYGDQDMGTIPSNSKLIFEVEMFDFEVVDDDGIDWEEGNDEVPDLTKDWDNDEL